MNASNVTTIKKLNRKKSINTKELKDYGISLLFILPSLIVLLLFVLIPIFQTLEISFFKWDGISPTREFVGLTNYGLTFSLPQFQKALSNSFIWAVMHIIFACGTGFVLAFLISRVSRGKTFFRTVLFFPNVVALSVCAVMWAMLYNPQFGFVNGLLDNIGLGSLKQQWLSNPDIAIFSISIASSWQAYGYYMVLFLAGLQNIDITLYEAARIDGANSVQQFRYVTIPGLRNVFTFVLSMAIINGLKGFATVWTMTQGGPEYSTYLPALFVFRKAFVEYDFGVAATGGILLGALIIVITVIFNYFRDKHVVE